ncbi:hypothetical protein ACPPVU_10325 [Mucilaginibacter sp. McL0603]|uniref:hypothetical protein n=1 Tax=Mucilaginibacter sp. McL0603 TaxID=3415670 RepID=UPI003CEF972F
MKYIYLLPLVAIVALIITSCSKSNVKPTTSTKADTSNTLTADIRLVGNWNILTDTINFQGNGTIYHGVATDHFIFTKYGNLYIKEGLANLIDTAVYSVASITNSVSWINTYISVNGAFSTIHSQSLPYVITKLDTASLILTSNASTAQGPRYEQITFKKKK